MTSTETALELRNVEVFYDGIIRALEGVSLHVGRGEIVALLGANGAGKSTTLRAASGLLPAVRGTVTAGEFLIDGRDARTLTARELVQRGLVHVVEGRHCFPHLTVIENLKTGTLAAPLFSARARSQRVEIEEVLELFPRLRDRRTTRAGLLSGGEQQMLAIGRALMCRPSVLLLDEPSMGLAPRIVAAIFATIAELNRRRGVTVLLAEQNARVALRYAHRAYVLENGRVAAEDRASALRERDDVREFYLGVNHRARRSDRAPTTAPG